MMKEINYSTGVVTIWLREKQAGKQIYYHFDGNYLVQQERKNDCMSMKDSSIKPFLILPEEFANAIIKTFAEFANNSGIAIEHQSKVEGKLEATKKHLLDMQMIVKKVLKIEQ